MHKLCYVHESAKSGSVTAATVCSLTTHLLFLVLSALSRFLTCAGEKCRLHFDNNNENLIMDNYITSGAHAEAESLKS